MSDVIEELAKSGFVKSIILRKDMAFLPFNSDTQEHLRKAFGEGWSYGVNRNDMVWGFLIYRKEIVSHVHEFKCDCGEKRVVVKNE